MSDLQDQVDPQSIRIAVQLPSTEQEETNEQRKRRLIAEHRKKVRELKTQDDVDSGTIKIPSSGSDDTMFVHMKAPIVTLIAQHPETISIPKQLRFEGKFVIPDEIANLSCAALGLDGLLEHFNRIHGSSVTLDAPALRSQLQRCIDADYDFGVAYAQLRTRWRLGLRELEHTMDYCRTKDARLRTEALRGDHITTPLIPPRRVWDLYSNRVVPYWVMDTTIVPPKLWAVSHSWMPVERRQNVWTAVNGRAWPVPLPDDATLERVRIELLNMGAEYVWLDVLCLRQWSEDEANEALRKAEWPLDVPTIGTVYQADRNQNVVCYYSGLGRPFTVEEGFIDDNRHWLRRAWTLQETSANRIIGGWTDRSPFDSGIYGDSPGDAFYRMLHRLVVLWTDRPANVFVGLQAMRQRDSVNPVDKVAGLAYVLQSASVPVYREDEGIESAWTRLVENMHKRFRGDLFFLYPHPGDGPHLWRPSWAQLMAELPAVAGTDISEAVEHDFREDMGDWANVYYNRGYTVDDVLVRGLSCLPAEDKLRLGEIVIERPTGTFTFKVSARHRRLIPEDRYTLVGEYGLEYWVVGKAKKIWNADKFISFEKVSVVTMDEENSREALGALNVGLRKEVFLL